MRMTNECKRYQSTRQLSPNNLINKTFSSHLSLKNVMADSENTEMKEQLLKKFKKFQMKCKNERIMKNEFDYKPRNNE